MARRGRHDARAPITFSILTELLPALNTTCSSSYETVLFQAAFSLAFFAFLHVGEFTAKSAKDKGDKILQISDIRVGQSLKLLIRFSKADHLSRATVISINCRSLRYSTRGDKENGSLALGCLQNLLATCRFACYPPGCLIKTMQKQCIRSVPFKFCAQRASFSVVNFHPCRVPSLLCHHMVFQPSRTTPCLSAHPCLTAKSRDEPRCGGPRRWAWVPLVVKIKVLIK